MRKGKIEDDAKNILRCKIKDYKKDLPTLLKDLADELKKSHSRGEYAMVYDSYWMGEVSYRIRIISQIDDNFLKAMIELAKHKTYIAVSYDSHDSGDGCGGFDTEYYQTNVIHPMSKINSILAAVLYVAENINKDTVIKRKDFLKIAENIIRFTFYQQNKMYEKNYMWEWVWLEERCQY